MPYLVPDRLQEPLYAVVPYFNPWRWKSREKHALRAIKHFSDSGAVVIVVEAAFNRRDLTLADSGLPDTLASCSVLGTNHNYRHQYIGLRTKDESWLKESLVTCAVARLPWDWQNVCWLDSDVHFLRPNWVGECAHKLQHYSFLQMFSQARDLGPNYEMLPEDYPHASGVGFVTAHQQGLLETKHHKHRHHHGRHHHHHHHPHPYDDDLNAYPYGQASAPRVFPGLAWACTRKAWDDVGGIPDYHIWGGGDHVASHALVGKRNGMIRNDLHPNYQQLAFDWFDKCERHIRRNVGTMEGAIMHHFHGRKVGRGYGAKHTLLAKIGFDPVRHLKRDYQGLWQLNDDGSEAFVQLRDTMRQIAFDRNEDTNDVRIDLYEQGH